MRFINRKVKEPEPYMAESAYPRPFIDLSTIGPSAGVRGAEKLVKVAEVESFRTISRLADIIYQGNILVLDFTPIANDDMELRRCVEELKRIASDVGGDVAGIAQNMIMVTPRGIKIDRKKLRRSEPLVERREPPSF